MSRKASVLKTRSICSAISIQYRRVTTRWTDTRSRTLYTALCIYVAYASRRKNITLDSERANQIPGLEQDENRAVNTEPRWEVSD